MHFNSLVAYEEGLSGLSRRARRIYEYLSRSRFPLTDRAVAAGMGYPHRSYVQPRISEMVKKGWLEEVGTAVDRITGKHVRLCRAVPPGELIPEAHACQTEMNWN